MCEQWATSECNSQISRKCENWRSMLETPFSVNAWKNTSPVVASMGENNGWRTDKMITWLLKCEHCGQTDRQSMKMCGIRKAEIITFSMIVSSTMTVDNDAFCATGFVWWAVLGSQFVSWVLQWWWAGIGFVPAVLEPVVFLQCDCNVGVKWLNNVKKQKKKSVKRKKKSIKTKNVSKEQQDNAICEFQEMQKLKECVGDTVFSERAKKCFTHSSKCEKMQWLKNRQNDCLITKTWMLWTDRQTKWETCEVRKAEIITFWWSSVQQRQWTMMPFVWPGLFDEQSWGPSLFCEFCSGSELESVLS